MTLHGKNVGLRGEFRGSRAGLRPMSGKTGRFIPLAILGRGRAKSRGVRQYRSTKLALHALLAILPTVASYRNGLA
jgi:hypothetical protein